MGAPPGLSVQHDPVVGDIMLMWDIADVTAAGSYTVEIIGTLQNYPQVTLLTPFLFTVEAPVCELATISVAQPASPINYEIGSGALTVSAPAYTLEPACAADTVIFEIFTQEPWLLNVDSNLKTFVIETADLTLDQLSAVLTLAFTQDAV